MFDTDTIQSLDETMVRLSATSAAALGQIGEIEDGRIWQRDGATSMSSWLACRYGLAWGTAREWVRVARALRSLPSIARAYAEGRVSWDQLRQLTRFATSETDAEWAIRGRDMSPASLLREAKRHERVQLAEERDIQRKRYLTAWWDQELPVLWLEGMLPAEQGSAVLRALEERAQEVVLAEEVSGRPHEARLADALVELVTGDHASSAAVATLVVHAAADVLTGEASERGPWLSETESGERLSSETVRRLACDSRIEWMLESDGRAVGIGRRGRIVPGGMLRALRFRDRGCRFPGCERERWLHAHHLVHWARGGGTNLGNLVLLCPAHHRLIHEGGWRTSGHPAHDLRFHDPTGRALRYGPAGRLEARLESFP